MDRLQWDRVWLRHGRRWVLRGATLGLPEGCSACLVGAAGAGKTTLLHVAAGYLRPGKGSVWLDGSPLRRHTRGVLRPDDALPRGASVSEAILRRLGRFGVRGRQTDQRLRLALREWGLGSLRDETVGALSDSHAARARLAAAWACPAALWLEDNPTALLEPEWRERWPHLLSDWARRDGGTMVFASAEPEDAGAADLAVVVAAGRVVALGPAADLAMASGPEEIVVRTVDDAAAARTLAAGLRLEAERRPDGLRLRVRNAEEAAPGILQTLGASVETVWVRRPTMRDVVARHAAQAPAADAATRPPRA